MRNYYLYLIRHGITQGNLDGRYIGRTDLALCPQGEETIKSYAAMSLYPEVEKVYSSPLRRCLETAEIIYPDNKLMIVDELSEMDFGDFEGKTSDELMELPSYIEWIHGGIEACPPGGEKFGDFTLRCVDGLDSIFRNMMDRNILRAAVVTHSGVITNLLAGLGLPKRKPVEYMCGPGEGFEIMLSAFMWQHGPTFEVSGRLF